MRAVDRSTRKFVDSVRSALPEARIQLSRSKNSHGRSNYVYIYAGKRCLKVRISDHAIGMQRALSGREDLYITAGTSIDGWSVWLGDLVRDVSTPSRPEGQP